MISPEIKHYGEESAKAYKAFLAKNGRGVERISVNSIEKLPSNKYNLYLSKKLFDSENICLEIKNNTYTTTEIPVDAYDMDASRLTLSPKEQQLVLFSSLSEDDIYIVSSLQFLIERVERWYKDYKGTITLDRSAPSIAWEPVGGMTCSAEQEEALKTIFSSPLSYVWGAPGTGKTRYVLSGAVLNYLNSPGKRVAIVAPTNNALEQSLRGILGVLKDHGVSYDRVLRLGIPTAQFARDYPECCEVRGLEKRLEMLTEQRNNYIGRLKAVDLIPKYLALKNEIIPRIDMLIERYQVRNEFQKHLDNQKSKLKIVTKLAEEYASFALSGEKRISAIEAFTGTFAFKLLRLFAPSKATAKLEEKSVLMEQMRKDHEKSIEYQKEATIIRARIFNKQKIINGLAIEQLTTEIINLSKVSDKFTTAVSNWLDENDVISTRSTLLSLQRKGEERLDELGLSQNDSKEGLKEKIDTLTEEIERLKVNSTEKRLEETPIIAATIDGFISKLAFDGDRSKVKFDHIFLDEAGYCSLAKGAILFSRNCPITLLGDHMQLPPVCEANDKDMESIDDPTAEYVFLWAQSVLAAEDLFCLQFDTAYEKYISREPFTFDIIKKSDLYVTHRFGEGLSNILNDYVYRNGLRSADETQEFSTRIIHARKRAGEKNRENPAEAEAIKQLLSEEAIHDFAVLSPYTNQVKLLKRTLPGANAEQRIMTVHASQGREWDTVILSVSDTWNKFFTDSLNTETRGLQLINTAVSRTKRQLIIVCDTNYWSAHPEQLIGAFVDLNR